MGKLLFTSESVTEGHPDKACDAFSDAILDSILEQDNEAHVACESLATKGLVVISGEVRTDANIDTEKVVKDTIREIGCLLYTSPSPRDKRQSRMPSSA